MESAVIKGVVTKEGYHFFSTRQKLTSLVSWFKDSGVILKFFSQSLERIGFLCEEDSASSVREFLKSCDPSFTEIKKVALVSVVGEGVSSSKDILPKCLTILGALESEPLLAISNSLSLTLAVPSHLKGQLAQNLHQELIEKV